ncbi:MAG: hypothetical protein AB1714_14595 [Acidobacteriota bacterium]
MNEEPDQRRLTLPGILGFADRPVIWPRAIAFLIAYVLASVVPLIWDLLTMPQDFPADLRTWILMQRCVVPFVLVAAAVAGYRFIRNQWIAAAVSGLVYLVVMTPVRYSLNPYFRFDLRILYSWLWVFLTLIGIGLALRVCRSLVLAVFLGYYLASLLDSIVINVIYLVTDHESHLDLVSELTYQGVEIVFSGVFALSFWAALRVRLCKPELLGTEAAATVAGTLPASGEAGNLQAIFDFQTLRSHLRAAGIGSILFGVIAVLLGGSSLGEVPINAILLVLGFLLIGEGIWVLVAPSPAGMIFDGIVLILVGLWNLVVTAYSAQAPGSGPAGFAVLGVMQVVWGFQSMLRYRRYAHLGGQRLSAEDLAQGQTQIEAIWRADLSGTPDIIEFKTRGFLSQLVWRGKLLTGSLATLRSGKPFMVVPKGEAELTIPEAQLHQDPMKGKLRLEKLTLGVALSRDAYARFQQWKTT